MFKHFSFNINEYLLFCIGNVILTAILLYTVNLKKSQWLVFEWDILNVFSGTLIGIYRL